MMRLERERRDLAADGMTPKQRRRAVLIAQDVLRWLRTKRLNVQCGDYLRFVDTTLFGLEGSLKQALPSLVTNARPCRVCALGACFLASVDRFNQVEITYSLTETAWVQYRVLTRHLANTFSQGQLLLIESAFEKTLASNIAVHRVEPHPIEPDAAAFGQRFFDPRRRLRAIMRNLIENKGVFVPPPAKETV